LPKAIIHPPSSVFRPQSSIVCHLTSILGSRL
jgi:hypothetical protein